MSQKVNPGNLRPIGLAHGVGRTGRLGRKLPSRIDRRVFLVDRHLHVARDARQAGKFHHRLRQSALPARREYEFDQRVAR